MSPLNGIERIVRVLGEKTALVFLAAVALTAYEVVLRYFFNAPTTWVHETTIALTAAAFIIGGAYTLHRRDHIRIGLVFDVLPAPWRRRLGIVNLLIALGYLAALCYGAAVQAGKSLAVMETTGTASNLPIPVALKTLLTAGVALMFAQCAIQLWRTLRGEE